MKHSLLYALDSRTTLLNTIGTQLATADAVLSPKAWAEQVDKVTAADLNRVVCAGACSLRSVLCPAPLCPSYAAFCVVCSGPETDQIAADRRRFG